MTKTKSPPAAKKTPPAFSQNGSHRSKVKELEVLAELLARLKRRGKKIVHSHGVFDLLHVGHIRHFESARAMGDVLVVTLTPDQHVNKGPQRPAFPQDLRAEAIASLGMVDYVAVNRWPTAEKTIKLLKPDIYAKGPDYKDAAKDVTGGISLEEEAVRSVGGELKITDDITFSSSNLINRHLPQFDPAVNLYLEGLRKRHGSNDIADRLNKLRGLKVLVVGEAILDEYVYCDALESRLRSRSWPCSTCPRTSTRAGRWPSPTTSPSSADRWIWSLIWEPKTAAKSSCAQASSPTCIPRSSTNPTRPLSSSGATSKNTWSPNCSKSTK